MAVTKGGARTKLVWALVVLVGLGAFGALSSAGKSAAPTGQAAVVQARSSVTVTGSGIEKSRPFDLAGSYTVTWTATPDNKVGCYHGASLERADGGPLFEMLANEMLDDSTQKSGTTRLYNLKSASYFVNASSGCGWSFTFAPA